MAPTFAQHYPTVKIIAPETANCPDCDKYITPLLANPAAAGRRVHHRGPRLRQDIGQLRQAAEGREIVLGDRVVAGKLEG